MDIGDLCVKKCFDVNLRVGYSTTCLSPYLTDEMMVINFRPIVGNGNSRKILLAYTMRSMKRREKVLLRIS